MLEHKGVTAMVALLSFVGPCTAASVPADNYSRMPYLRVRYRHEVKCPEPDCGALVVPEGRTSEAVYADGVPVKIESGADSDLRSGFIQKCPAGHEIDLYAPRDLQVLKASGAEPDFQPIILRSGLS